MQPLQLRWSVCDCVYDCENDHGRRSRIRHVRDGDVRGNDRGRRNRIHHARDGDVRDYGRVHMNKSSFLRSYLSPLSVHQVHDAHFKYFFNMIVVKAVKYMLADLS